MISRVSRRLSNKPVRQAFMRKAVERVVRVVFSPTGGTNSVANLLSAQIGEYDRQIDLTDAKLDFSREQVTSSEVAVIAAPSYGGRIPHLAAQRLAQVRGNGARAVVVSVYGNRDYEDSLVELQDVAQAAGFRVVAGVAAVAEHSIVHQYAGGRPDERDVQRLSEIGNHVAQFLQEEPCLQKLTLPGNRPYKKDFSMSLVPQATSACTGCGICADHCPAQAISHENPRSTDKAKCISCMRCVSICPHHARRPNRFVVWLAGLMIKSACSKRKEPELFL